MVFDNLAVFTGAAFGDATKFDDSVFNGWALFNGESKEKRTAELGASPEPASGGMEREWLRT